MGDESTAKGRKERPEGIIIFDEWAILDRIISGKRGKLMIIIRKLSLFAGLVALIGLAGCGGGGGRNPASVYCTQHGGTSEIRDEAGGQVGYCVFADGSECEEFAYMNGECAPGDSLDGGEGVGLPNPASVYCEENGGELEIRDEEAHL